MDKEMWLNIYREILFSQKKKANLPFVIACIDLENIITEIKQKQKEKYCMIIFICGILREKRSSL